MPKSAGRYIIGGIEARDLETLATALITEARQADEEPDVDVLSRHVNTRELRELCGLIVQELED